MRSDIVPAATFPSFALPAPVAPMAVPGPSPGSVPTGKEAR
jgi:hypothetical protein